MSTASDLPRSFEELGERLGFTPEQLRLRYGNHEKEHEAFMAAFGRSILYAAERDRAFYARAESQAADRENGKSTKTAFLAGEHLRP